MTPCLHGAPGFVPHATPAVHATHEPALLHTWFVPQLAPGGRLPTPSRHAGAAPVQLCTPTRHGVGFPVHAAPGVHIPQMPPLHVSPAPHIVPFIWFAALSTHTGAPEPQSVVPCLQNVGFPVHAAP